MYAWYAYLRCSHHETVPKIIEVSHGKRAGPHPVIIWLCFMWFGITRYISVHLSSTRVETVGIDIRFFPVYPAPAGGVFTYFMTLMHRHTTPTILQYQHIKNTYLAYTYNIPTFICRYYHIVSPLHGPSLHMGTNSGRATTGPNRHVLGRARPIHPARCQLCQ